jgi:hypothetical protein
LRFAPAGRSDGPHARVRIHDHDDEAVVGRPPQIGAERGNVGGVPEHDRHHRMLRQALTRFGDRAAENPGARQCLGIPEQGRAMVGQHLRLAGCARGTGVDALEEARKHREPVGGVPHQVGLEQDLRLCPGTVRGQPDFLAQRGREIAQCRIVVGRCCHRASLFDRVMAVIATVVAITEGERGHRGRISRRTSS